MRLIEYLRKFLRWIGLNYFDYAPTPYDDQAHAGRVGKVLTPNQIQSLMLTAITTLTNALFTDTSRWQLEIDYAKTKAAGAVATILKAGQGYGADPYFKANFAKAKAAGLKRGTYWYYDSRVNPLVQAKLWADLLQDDSGELPHFADYEEKYNGDFAGRTHFKAFLEEFKRRTGFHAERYGIYTGYFYWLLYGSEDVYWQQYWLWLAWYGNAVNVLLPKPWTQDMLWGWQYTDNGDGTRFGVSSLNIDLNFFVKGLTEFERMYGDVVEVPQTGETMEGLFEIWSDVYAMTLRTSPAVTTIDNRLRNPDGTVVPTIPRATRMKADRIVPPVSGGLSGDKWAHVTEVNGVARDAYVAIIHNGLTYCNFREIVTDTRPKPRIALTFTDRDGKTWMLEGEMVERP